MDGITTLGTIGAALLVVDFIDVVDLVFDEGTRGRSIELCDDYCDDPGVVT